MICQNPMYLTEILERKKRIETSYKFDPITKEISVNDTKIPCGHCTGCKIMRAKEWALRCCLELPYWNDSIFTTLTYRDEDLPYDKSIHKEVLNEFVDKLRDRTRNRKIKIMGCGEYGDNNFRCHYHAIIFGIGQDFSKKIQYGKDITYQSENQLIEKCWTYGNVFNGAVTYQSSRYVASYIFKKYNGKMEEDIYTSNGYVTPFQKISNGIGKAFYDEYKDIIFKRGYILFNGVKHSIPRYFYKLADKENYFEKHNLDSRKEYLTKQTMERYQEIYNNKISDLAKKYLMQPDEFNANIIGDYKNLQRKIAIEYKKEKETFDLNKAKHLDYKDKIYNGVNNL